MLNTIYSFFIRIAKITTYIAGLLIYLITILGMIDIIGRYFFLKPLLGQVEITRILLVYTVSWGFAYAHKKDQFVRIEVIDKYLNNIILKNIQNIIINISGIFVMGFMTFATWKLFWKSWIVKETFMSPIVLPTWLAKFALPVAFFMFTLTFIFDLIINYKKFVKLRVDK